MGTSNPGSAIAGPYSEGSAGQPLKIFINYRHQDVPFAASMLYQEFKGRFGQENIFFDQGALRPGMRFLEQITSRLTGTPGVFIAVIGPSWVSAVDEHRRRNDDDYVVDEIDLALQNGWTIIPLLVNDAPLPRSDQLPRSVRALGDHHVAYLHQTSLEDDLAKLTALLGEMNPGPDIEAGVRAETVAQPPDTDSGTGLVPELSGVEDNHYQALIDEAYEDNLVIFLGAGVNAADYGVPFRAGTPMLPDDVDLARYLATRARLASSPLDLAEVAQQVRMVSGEPNVYKWAKQSFRGDPDPGPVHTYLARLPKRLKQLGLGQHYQMIVTPKFDVALERAFLKEKEPYDVAIYMAPRTEHAGRFVHLPWQSADPRPVLTNEYDGFPTVGHEGELTRTVIVRINGAIDDVQAGYSWDRNFVITEDHYIDYLRGRSAEAVVPMQILAKLRAASCLFLGYAIADWRLRVFLHWIWEDDTFGGATVWAVEHDPDVRERQFWQRSGVSLYECRLTDYVQGFDRFLEKRHGKPG